MSGTRDAGHGAPEAGPLRAAGGLVERRSGGAVRIAVVHRRRYADRDGTPGDVVLPKGKLRAGESLEAAALREVREETGCRARITGPAFSAEYRAGGRRKVVTYFRMASEDAEGVPDPGEVESVMWLDPAGARARLTHDTERAVVARAYPDAGSPA